MTQETTGGPVRVYYRTVTASGILWCESSDPQEVIAQTTREYAHAAGPFTYERLAVYEVTHGWEQWIPGVNDDDVSSEGAVG